MLKDARFFRVVGANVLLISAILVFATGFFPYKASLPGLATWKSDSSRTIQPAPFDKVIFMVVDALRSDFVYGNTSNFHFTQGLIRSGAAVPFTGHASPPTITMPRVKAITTGSVPSFVDLVLNFAESDTTSTLATQDSWLAQMRAKGNGKLLHYGDDTWLRLFPAFFDRADGTTSFFVSDFTEVDNNVTRHVTPELQRDDWSVMTLHYLGLDHIGHKTGPKGPNMPRKQSEMDGIVKEIYEALESKEHLSSALLVLLGDHGMNEGGNHGANSAGEVSTALAFISPKFKSQFKGLPCPEPDPGNYEFYDLVEQSDIAPSLAALLGFPVPSNNLGVVIAKLLGLYAKSEDQYRLLYDNAKQIHDIALATFPGAFEQPCTATSPTDVDELACLWSQIEKADSPTDLAIHDVSLFLRRAQLTLSRTASNYDTAKLLTGIGLSIAAAVISTASLTTLQPTSLVSLTTLGLLIVSYGITMFASSYVEEEHQFWYWTTSGFLSFLYSRTSRFGSATKTRLSSPLSALVVLLLFGISRRWNQTGQKYAGDPDILTESVAPNPFFLWFLIIATYSIFSRNLSQRAAKWMDSTRMGVLPVLVAMTAFIFKVAFTAADAPELVNDVLVLRPLINFVHKYPLLNLARVCFMGLVQLLGCAIYYEAPWKSRTNLQAFMKSFQDIFTLFILTQTRTTNIPLFLMFYLQMRLLEHSNALSPIDISITSILFQFASFFALGGTNAISTIDLSNAYNGVGGYSIVAVGALTFISNWAGPIWWSVATCRLLVNSAVVQSVPRAAADHFIILTLFTSCSTMFVMVACYVLREHLFIWTVFSPKYLYTIAWVFGQHLVVNGGCALLLSRAKRT